LPSPWMPDAAKPYLVVVADPPSGSKPNGNIIESNEINNKASFQLARVIIEPLPVGNPVMGDDYLIQVRVANITAFSVTITLGIALDRPGQQVAAGSCVPPAISPAGRLPQADGRIGMTGMADRGILAEDNPFSLRLTAVS